MFKCSQAAGRSTHTNQTCIPFNAAEFCSYNSAPSSIAWKRPAGTSEPRQRNVTCMSHAHARTHARTHAQQDVNHGAEEGGTIYTDRHFFHPDVPNVCRWCTVRRACHRERTDGGSSSTNTRTDRKRNPRRKGLECQPTTASRTAPATAQTVPGGRGKPKETTNTEAFAQTVGCLQRAPVTTYTKTIRRASHNNIALHESQQTSSPLNIHEVTTKHPAKATYAPSP